MPVKAANEARRLLVFGAALMAVGQFAPGVAMAGASGLHVAARIAGPDGGWDYASFDPGRRRLYVAHSTVVTAVDVDTGKVTPAFAAGDHLHSVLAIPGTDLVATTNSGDNTARFINADTGALVASVATAKDADSAVFDAASGQYLVIGGDSATITIIDPKTAKATATITVGGGLEFPAVDGHGRLYVNNEQLNEIDVVDIGQKSVVGRYPLAGCQRPTGLAYVTRGRLISACANGVAKIIDAADGHEVASLPVGLRPDAVLYDEQRQLAMVPAGADGTLTVIALSGPDDNKVIDVVPTQVGARTGAIDPKTGRVYLPTAEFLPPAAPGERPKPKPGTFQILVLDR